MVILYITLASHFYTAQPDLMDESVSAFMLRASECRDHMCVYWMCVCAACLCVDCFCAFVDVFFCVYVYVCVRVHVCACVLAR